MTRSKCLLTRSTATSAPALLAFTSVGLPFAAPNADLNLRHSVSAANRANTPTAIRTNYAPVAVAGSP